MNERFEAFQAVEVEYLLAIRNFPKFNSPHEGWAVIKEELDELWEEVRTWKGPGSDTFLMRKEAMQVAAMAIRFMIDMDKEAKG